MAPGQRYSAHWSVACHRRWLPWAGQLEAPGPLHAPTHTQQRHTRRAYIWRIIQTQVSLKLVMLFVTKMCNPSHYTFSSPRKWLRNVCFWSVCVLLNHILLLTRIMPWSQVYSYKYRIK